MNMQTWWAAGLFAVVSAVTPGPNNAMLMASGVNFGFRRSVRHLLGVQLGFAIMLLCVGLGLHTVLARWPHFYDVLRYVGAAYMVWMAWKLASACPASAEAQAAARPMGIWSAAFFQWVNPKAWVMTVTCMSTYLPANASTPSILLLVALFLVLGSPCFALWLGFGQALRRWLQDPVRLRVFNIGMALALLAALYPVLQP